MTALAVIAVAAAGFAGRQSVLVPAADQALRLHGLLSLMLAVCGAMYLLVLALLAAALWRHRSRLTATAAETVSPDDRGLGLGLRAWTIMITAGLALLTGASFLVDRALADHDRSAVDVRVTAHQWWWRLEYRNPQGGWIESANELHLPAGRPMRIEIRSADVIHSFWIPGLSGKIDMIPGRTNHLTVTPRRVGWLRGQCAEFCGLQHARMALDVKVEPPAAFAAWMADQARPAASPSGSEAAHGLALIANGTCVSCHVIRGAASGGRAGPDLTHLASRKSLAAGTLPMTRGALAGWIVQPQALKPGAEMPATGLAPADALAVASYLEGLR